MNGAAASAAPVDLVADGERPRVDAIDGQPRRLVEVAVGVLLRSDDAFLLTSRPQGKVYAGYWEFPGGKLEAGEKEEQALRRELQEEIGITIAHAQAWRSSVVDYPHALVHLHFCKVREWSGMLTMREGQQCIWQQLPVTVEPVLPGAVPVLEWLECERSGRSVTS